MNEEAERQYYEQHRDDHDEWGDPLPRGSRRLLFRIWNCYCGRQHASWWRTTPPPSCTTRKVRKAR